MSGRIVSEGDLRVFLGLEAQMTSAERARLAQAHRRAEGLVKKELGYDPRQGQHAEFYPRHDHAGGTGLRDRDVVSVGSGDWESTGGFARYVPDAVYERTLQLTHVPLREIQDVYLDHGAYFGKANRSTFDDTFDLTFSDSLVGGSSRLTEGVDYYPDLEMPNYGMSGCLYHSGCWPTEPGSVAVRYIAGFSPSELMGSAEDSEAVEADRALGYISCVGVDASPITAAVTITVAKMLHLQYSLKRDAQGSFSGGGVFQSEKLQDYSYTRPGDASAMGTAQMVGMGVGLTAEALEYLEEFKHYGRLRL